MMSRCLAWQARLLAGLVAMGPLWAAELSAHLPADPPTGPAWVSDPARPGEHLPVVGASLFDALFATPGGTHAIPFPFERLLARIDAELARDPASALPPLKAVLIPLGRSLQRSAAAPDYFRFPRVVVGVDAPPAPGSPWLLKDRLYIGYLEKSAVLEVISYNEGAGRFEFQLVKDYRAGGNPQVYYANRNICMACHHNAAPIFSRALWDETNANPAIAARLAAEGRSYYGIAPARGVDMPYAIDNAVRRANRLALTQRLWQEGCGPAAAGQRCRAGLLEAALRLRLADGLSLPPDAAVAPEAAATLRRNAARRWPGGLALGRPDLPNRNPLQGLDNGLDDGLDDSAARIARSHVAAPFDPLLPRPPDTVWRADAPGAVREAVAGVAEFVADGHWLRLQAALARRGAALPRTEHILSCEAVPASRASRCRGAGGASLVLDPANRRIQGLSLAGEPPRAPFALSARPDLRLAGGDVLERMDASGLRGGEGPLRLRLRADGQALAAAISRLAAVPSLLDEQPLPRRALVAALLDALGDPLPALADRPRPPARLELPAGGTPAQLGVPAALAGFHAWCAACHLSAESFPPNFLLGPANALETRIRQCAPRIYVRLAMARLPPAARAKTPMPPETLLPAFRSHAAAWAASPERAALEAGVAAMLKAESGRDPDPETLLARGYEALRPCLAPDR
jgi:mono/diheme cytochrome c family protein